MSTCLRNGVTYKRHAYDDKGICMLCKRPSEWAKENGYAQQEVQVQQVPEQVPQSTSKEAASNQT